MKKIILFLLMNFAGLIGFSQQNQMIMLNHIAIYVVDLKTNTSFYNEIVSLDTIPEPFHDGDHTWFSVGLKSHLHVTSGAA